MLRSVYGNVHACIETRRSHTGCIDVLPTVNRNDATEKPLRLAVVKCRLSPAKVIAALPPRDAINTQIASRNSVGRDATTITNTYASRYDSGKSLGVSMIRSEPARIPHRYPPGNVKLYLFIYLFCLVKNRGVKMLNDICKY